MFFQILIDGILEQIQAFKETATLFPHNLINWGCAQRRSVLAGGVFISVVHTAIIGIYMNPFAGLILTYQVVLTTSTEDMSFKQKILWIVWLVAFLLTVCCKFHLRALIERKRHKLWNTTRNHFLIRVGLPLHLALLG